ncbi:MAG: hypothetical protein AAF340_14705 [Pseudomonadota bacterium]
MTALKEYQRLESTGIWRENAQAQRRDVIVSFGDASLIIKDKSDAALAHWSLPAIHRTNPGRRPALFQPAPDAEEELELSDPDLIEAIERIRKAIAKTQPRRGRLRLGILAAFLAAILALAIFWLPSALVKNTVAVLPESTRLTIGNAMLRHMTRLTGDTCRAPLGREALTKLTTRTVKSRLQRAYIVPDLGLRDTLILPGRLVLLDATLVEDHDSPEVAAGYLLKALTDRLDEDPMIALLEHAGPRATMGLLTTGQISDETLGGYAQTLLESAEPAPKLQGLKEEFQSARISAVPFAYAIDVTGSQTSLLLESDPHKEVPVGRLIKDGEWISLQVICGG